MLSSDWLCAGIFFPSSFSFSLVIVIILESEQKSLCRWHITQNVGQCCSTTTTTAATTTTSCRFLFRRRQTLRGSRRRRENTDTQSQTGNISVFRAIINKMVVWVCVCVCVWKCHHAGALVSQSVHRVHQKALHSKKPFSCIVWNTQQERWSEDVALNKKGNQSASSVDQDGIEQKEEKCHPC